MKQLLSITFVMCLISCLSTSIQKDIPPELAEHFTKDIIFGCHGYIYTYINIDNSFCFAGTLFRKSGLQRKSKIECVYRI